MGLLLLHQESGLIQDIRTSYNSSKMRAFALLFVISGTLANTAFNERGTNKVVIITLSSHFPTATDNCVVGEWSEWMNYHERTRTVSRSGNSLDGEDSCAETDTERREGSSRNEARFMITSLLELPT